MIIDLWGQYFNLDQDNKSLSRSNFTVKETNLSRLCGGRHKVNANVYNTLTSADKSRSVISPCSSNSESIAFAVCTVPCTFCFKTESNQCKANHFSLTTANTTVFWHVGTQTHEKKILYNQQKTPMSLVYTCRYHSKTILYAIRDGYSFPARSPACSTLQADKQPPLPQLCSSQIIPSFWQRLHQ